MEAIRFSGLKPSSDAASRAKRGNRARDRLHEILLRAELTRLGLRYQTYAPDIPGTPDSVFPKAKVVVFCDGDFWHGRNWPRLRRKLSRRHNAAYWVAKIRSNRRRDRAVSSKLARTGWHVVRIWETDILKDPQGAARSIHQLVRLKLRKAVASSKARATAKKH
jgi:DNA mismatch endonuclease (patch repair protein)